MHFFIHPNISFKSEYLDFCYELIKIQKLENEEEFVDHALLKRKELEKENEKVLSNDELDELIRKSVTLDLIAQGWRLTIVNEKVKVTIPSNISLEQSEAKSLIRKGMLIQRNQQLLTKSVKEFINRCERKRIVEDNWVSIFSLMRDGKELSEKLRLANSIEETEAKSTHLSNIIKPYIQIAESDKRCEFTKINLMEIWRYFRHTWVTPYKVLPGRSIAILIRDAAAKNHPIIGIGALGSAVAQHSVRDKWIGWEAETFLKKIEDNPSKKISTFLIEKLEALIRNLYLEDLFEEQILNEEKLMHPNEELIKKLRELSNKEIKKHRLSEDHSIFNKQKQNSIHSETNWVQYAETNLFKSKRLRTLSTLLNIRLAFNKVHFVSGSKKDLVTALESVVFRKSVGKLIRMIKAETVGINMMDIIICGAVAPYNHVLGGKLVCCLLASPEISKYYKRKYSETASIIASSMAGRKIKRDQTLVFLGTTSLYGVGSSQYNRIKIPAEKIGGIENNKIEYVDLGKSEGYGSFHFSQHSIDLIHHRVGRRNDGRRVNSIFGEGANPLMRKLREGLDLAGLPSQQILKHGNSRVVYGVPLAENFREYLIGLDKKPRYLIKQTKPNQRTELLSKYWIDRWLINRIKNQNVIEKVSKHTLDYPIVHGAKVVDVKDLEELTLID